MGEMKLVYFFGAGNAEGNGKMKAVLGGKGANLAEMSLLGLPVPPGFTIETANCREFYKNGKNMSAALLEALPAAIKYIEDTVGGVKFGGGESPLLVSVRSGAPVSMPGMMDTILNLGLNDETVEALAKRSNNRRFAYDSYRRFIQMYSDVVLGVDHHYFESILDDKKLELRVKSDTELDENALSNIIKAYKKLVKDKTGADFPMEPRVQLEGAIRAVFLSWMNDRAIYYRKMYGYSADMGTAVTVQAMVFGNLGETSATGVAFTRNPSDGKSEIYGEYLINAQGEDVVAGIRTPYPIDNASKTPENAMFPSLEDSNPAVYKQFLEISSKLERHYRDMQDIEFTIQDGKLWFLQTRSGKRTAKAAIKIAVDMVNEGLITKDEALLRIDPKSLDSILHKMLDPKASKTLIDKGLPASPGAACGALAFSVASVLEMARAGVKSILTRIETSPEDIEGMNVSEGILTTRGGMTSHAAVVARGMGKVCVTSARGMVIDYASKSAILPDGRALKEGDLITIDGSTGEVFLGAVPLQEPELSAEFLQLMSWADARRKLLVRANAETTLDTANALKFGAQGIGLCRTEHMFFDKDRILFVREMITADSIEGRKKALASLLPFQVADFTEIFKLMEGLPVNIRLLDPPLHEFLPVKESEVLELAAHLKMEPAKLQARIDGLHETNPMLGHRGCRLAITYPEIYEMQVRAIFSAAHNVLKSSGKQPIVEIMLPIIIEVKELEILVEMIKKVASEFESAEGKKIEYSVGTMIETPRAALIASKIAEHASYFSFGTNDLTQTTLAISRDDSSSFIPSYIEAGIFEKDPFVKLDEDGVGRLIKIAISEGRATRASLKASVCGEHGGDADSIKFCAKAGMNYVSCSPYRIMTARLAAAQAQIEIEKP